MKKQRKGKTVVETIVASRLFWFTFGVENRSKQNINIPEAVNRAVLWKRCLWNFTKFAIKSSAMKTSAMKSSSY